MNRSLRVAAVQLRAHDRAVFTQTLPAILDQIAEAANGTDLVVVPEGTFPAYVLGSEPVDRGAIETAVEALRDVARRTKTVLVAGVATAGGGRPRNAALVIDRDGAVAGRADKLFLWHFDRRWFEGGDCVAPVQTSIGTLGAFVCADGRIPTIARELVDRGAEILVMPTAWVTSGRNPDSLENVQADLLARVRARENGVPFVAANKCGAELGMVAYCGKSQIVDAAGEVVAIAPERESAIVRAVVDVGDSRPFRQSGRAPDAACDHRGGTRARGDLVRTAAVDLDMRLEMLDNWHAIAPGAPERFTALDRVVPTVEAGDDDVLDPAGLVGYRRAGYRLFVWTTAESPRGSNAWRALERSNCVSTRSC